MKLIIAGGRDINLDKVGIDCFIRFNGLHDKITEVVSGGARGIDLAGEQWASGVKYATVCTGNYVGRTSPVTVKVFPADWETHGKAAGPIRNKQMAEYGDALLIIWDGESPGSKNMKSEMTKLGKPVYEVILKAPK